MKVSVPESSSVNFAESVAPVASIATGRGGCPSLRTSEAADRKPTDTDEQFFYKVRKKALGARKLEFWSLPAEVRAAIGATLEERFTFLLTQLHVQNTRQLAAQHAPFVPGSFPTFAETIGARHGPEDVSGLSD